MNFTIINIIILFGGIQGFTLCWYLYKKRKPNPIAASFFIFFIFCLAVHNLIYAAIDKVYTYIDKTGKMNTKTPVVIINGIMTSSAGETLGLAFRGRENVLFVGEETYGFLTGNEMTYLPYGAQMAFSTCYMSDRNLKYTETIKPDISISKQDNFENLMLDANVIAAIKFIERKQ